MAGRCTAGVFAAARRRILCWESDLANVRKAQRGILQGTGRSLLQAGRAKTISKTRAQHLKTLATQLHCLTPAARGGAPAIEPSTTCFASFSGRWSFCRVFHLET